MGQIDYDLASLYDEDYDESDREITCLHCNTKHLYWFQLRGAWVLIDEDGVHHNCKRAIKNPTDAFDDIS